MKSNTEISIEKFEKLRFPVHKLGKNDSIKKAFPELFKLSHFQNFHSKDPESEIYQNREQLFRYVCFMYDPGSDLLVDYPDVNKRKEVAAYMAGFKRNDNDDWPMFVEKDIFEFTSANFTDLVVQFLNLFNNPLWQEICTLEQEIDRYTKFRLQGLRGTRGLGDASAAIKSDELEQITKKKRNALKSALNDFFQGDKDLADKVKQMKMITPETVDQYFNAS